MRPSERGTDYGGITKFGLRKCSPDAFTDLDFNIKSSRLAFTGVGYHDKNWANDCLANVVSNWYWGHGRLGPYSVVWFNMISPTGINSVSVYVSAYGRIIAAQCGGIMIRPTGLNNTYPPTATSGFPSGYNMTIDLGGDGVLVAEVGNEEAIAQYPGYMRYKGWFNGKVNGKSLPKGVALYEESKNLV